MKMKLQAISLSRIWKATGNSTSTWSGKKGGVSGAQKMISAIADGLRSIRCIVYPTIFISRKRLTRGLPFILSK